MGTWAATHGPGVYVGHGVRVWAWGGLWAGGSVEAWALRGLPWGPWARDAWGPGGPGVPTAFREAPSARCPELLVMESLVLARPLPNGRCLTGGPHDSRDLTGRVMLRRGPWPGVVTISLLLGGNRRVVAAQPTGGWAVAAQPTGGRRATDGRSLHNRRAVGRLLHNRRAVAAQPTGGSQGTRRPFWGSTSHCVRCDTLRRVPRSRPPPPPPAPGTGSLRRRPSLAPRSRRSSRASCPSQGRCQEAGAAAVTGGWGAVAVALLAVVKRLGGDGALTEAVLGGEH